MMNDLDDIFNDLLDKSPSAAAVTEANDRTIPSGTYKLEIVKKEYEPAGDKSPWPGRPMVRCSADAFYKNGDGEWHRRGRINFDLSPMETRVSKTGRLDSQSRLWANVALMAGKGSTNREILDYLGQYPLTATISRTFKTPDGRWVTPKTDKETDQLMGDGAEPRNFVQALRPFNG